VLSRGSLTLTITLTLTLNLTLTLTLTLRYACKGDCSDTTYPYSVTMGPAFFCTMLPYEVPPQITVTLICVMFGGVFVGMACLLFHPPTSTSLGAHLAASAAVGYTLIGQCFKHECDDHPDAEVEGGFTSRRVLCVVAAVLPVWGWTVVLVLWCVLLLHLLTNSAVSSGGGRVPSSCTQYSSALLVCLAVGYVLGELCWRQPCEYGRVGMLLDEPGDEYVFFGVNHAKVLFFDPCVVWCVQIH
jgi:hypothetical protein